MNDYDVGGLMVLSMIFLEILSVPVIIILRVTTPDFFTCWHSDNCTCERCEPVKEYCPCGCGQYEIVYR